MFHSNIKYIVRPKFIFCLSISVTVPIQPSLFPPQRFKKTLFETLGLLLSQIDLIYQ